MIKFLYKKNKDVYNFVIIKKRYIIELWKFPSQLSLSNAFGVWGGCLEKAQVD